MFEGVAIEVRYVTDPGCPESWATEPVVRKLIMDFGGNLRWTFVMGGLSRDYGELVGAQKDAFFARLVAHWLDVAEDSGMPLDPRLWLESPLRSTYPACTAVKAAAEQAGDGGYAYLRRLREGLMCERRKLDHGEALVEEARAAGLDVQRFRVDLSSHAITELFGADLDEVRDPPADALAAGRTVTDGRHRRLPFPSIAFIGGDGERHWVIGRAPYEAYRGAAEAAGAVRERERPAEVEELVRRFGRVATREVETVCELPAPRARAELWRLAGEWRLRPERRLTGTLWQLA